MEKHFLREIRDNKKYKVIMHSDYAEIEQKIDAAKPYIDQLPDFAEGVMFGRGRGYKIRAAYYKVRL